MDLSVKSNPTNRTSPLEGTSPYYYPVDVRHHYEMVHPYLISSTPMNVPYHPYYPGIAPNFAALPLKLENPIGYSKGTPYHHDSEDTRSNASSTHGSDHLPDSSAKSLNSDCEKDLNCNRLSPKLLLKPSSRPFKAINPLGLTLNSFGVDSDSVEAYEEFRKKMLSQVQNSSTTNKNMRRTIQSGNPKYSDVGYLEKRQRNNEAAKRSRDARRAKEDEIAIRCAFLEQENIKLKIQLANTEKQKKMLLGLRRQ